MTRRVDEGSSGSQFHSGRTAILAESEILSPSRVSVRQPATLTHRHFRSAIFIVWILGRIETPTQLPSDERRRGNRREEAQDDTACSLLVPGLTNGEALAEFMDFHKTLPRKCASTLNLG